MMSVIDYKKIKTNIVAFDFFDTIVHRDCNPEIILFKWAKEVSCYLRFSISSSVIYQIRKKIETEKKSNGLEEVAYQDLLAELYNRLKNLSKSEYFPDIEDFVEFSKELEVLLEIEHIYIDNEILDIIKFHYENGKKLYVISDFYADSKLIGKILEHLGIKHYFEDIIVSSEYNARKSSGRLFEKFLSITGLEPHQVTMIGDNYISDFVNPSNIGLNAYFREYTPVEDSLIDDKGLEKLYKDVLFSDAENAPFNGFLADILYFVSKLHVQLTKDRVTKVLFCSREGQLLKELFDLYQSTFLHKNKIQTYYFYVSRRSTLIPSLTNPDVEDFDIIFRQYKKISLENFLLNLNFSDEEIKQIAGDLRVEIKETLEKNSKLLELLKSNPVFLKRYMFEKSKSSNFRDYVNSLTSDDTIYLVDIGWKGTIQDNIQRALSDKIIIGYYFGLKYQDNDNISKKNKFGIMFNDFPEKTEFFDIISRNYEFYEDIFVADHGPTIAYKSTNGKVIPILDNDRKHVKVYEMVHSYQENMITVFKTLLEGYSNSCKLPYDCYNLFIINSLKKECVFAPKLFLLKERLRDNVIENFGEVVIKKKVRLSKKSLFLLKMDFLWVDFAYMAFYKISFGKIFSKMYCYFVFFLKRFILKLRNGI